METSNNQPDKERRCRECGMPLKSAQGTCSFCGESNPLLAGVDARKIDPKPEARPSAIDNAPTKLMHGPTRAASDLAADQQRDPICPRCGKDNSKITNARFCFACGTTLAPLRLDSADAAASPAPPRCPHCGKDMSAMPKGGRFCLFCGKPIIDPILASSATQPTGTTGNEKTIAPAQQPVPLHTVLATPTLSEAIVSAQEMAAPTQRSPTPRTQPGVTTARPVQPHPTAPIHAQPPVERVDMLNIACRYEAPVLSAAFSKDGARFFVGTARNEIIARETTNARVRRTFYGEQTGRAITVLAEPDGNGFTTCMNGAAMRFTRVAIQEPGTGSITSRIKTSQSAILAVAVDQAVSMLLLGGYDKIVEVWDLKAGKLLFTLAGHTGAVDAVAFDSTGKLVATGGRDGAVKVWKAENGEMVRNFFAHTKPVLSLSFSPDSSRLASGSGDGSIKIWDPERNSAVSTLTGHRGSVLALSFNHDGNRLVSGGQDTVARVWDVEAAKEIRTIETHVGAINAVAISPDGTRVVSGGADKRSYHWTLEAEKK